MIHGGLVYVGFGCGVAAFGFDWALFGFVVYVCSGGLGFFGSVGVWCI